MPRLIKLDIGANARQVKNTIGIDRYLVPEGGVCAEFSLGLPFKDNCADTVYAYHVLEHVDDLVGFMEEIWRVCKHNAVVYVRVPHATSPFVTWVDPNHKRGFTIETFGYFGHYHRARFHIEHARLHFTTGGPRRLRVRFIRNLLSDIMDALANKNRVAQYRCERWWGHWLGFDEAFVVLRADKKPWVGLPELSMKKRQAKTSQQSEER